MYYRVKLDKEMSLSEVAQAIESSGFNKEKAGVCSIHHDKEEGMYATVWVVEPELAIALAKEMGLMLVVGGSKPTVH